jgi:rhamnosyl/mannosyltransferase
MENHLFTLINELKSTICLEVLVANNEPSGVLETVDGIKVRRVPKLFEISSTPICPTLPYWMRKWHGDIFHIHLPNPFAEVSYLLARHKDKLIVAYHSDIVGRGKFFDLYRPLRERFLNKADRIIVSSDNYLSSSPALLRFRDKIVIILYEIDINELECTREVEEKASQIRDRFGERIVLFVGRLTYYKGVEYLLHALKGIDAKLLIIGRVL